MTRGRRAITLGGGETAQTAVRRRKIGIAGQHSSIQRPRTQRFVEREQVR
jgi:hypothetical protein